MASSNNPIKTNFVVLSGPRTGSSAIRLWLNSHSQIRCHDEVLHKTLDTPDAIKYFAQASFPNIDYDETNLGYTDNQETQHLLHAYLTNLYLNPKHSSPWSHFDERRKTYSHNNTFYSERAVGFKLMYYLLDSRLLRQWLSNNTVKILHLTRDNILKQYLSYLTAKESNLYHSVSETTKTKVTVETSNLINVLDYLSKGTEKFHRQFDNENYLRINYENFCEQPQALWH